VNLKFLGSFSGMVVSSSSSEFPHDFIVYL